jgi:putative SbcD/Mre11-related phosphoesterase
MMRRAPRIGPWRLDPEGAFVHTGERLAVVADVHLGYEWARGRQGDCVPAHSLAETIAKLSRLLARQPVGRLVVAGDLVESRRRCRRTEADVRTLRQWLGERGVELIALAGNHDPPRRPAWPDALEVDGWTIAHGHRPVGAPRAIIGHHHPVLRAGGLCTPCFLLGRNQAVLPAFSLNAAGCNVLTERIPTPCRAELLRCVVASDDGWLDFGEVADVRLTGRR